MDVGFNQAFPSVHSSLCYGDDIARLYSRFGRSKIIDAALFVDCFFEANDDPFAVIRIG